MYGIFWGVKPKSGRQWTHTICDLFIIYIRVTKLKSIIWSHTHLINLRKLLELRVYQQIWVSHWKLQQQEDTNNSWTNDNNLTARPSPIDP